MGPYALFFCLHQSINSDCKVFPLTMLIIKIQTIRQQSICFGIPMDKPRYHGMILQDNKER